MAYAAASKGAPDSITRWRRPSQGPAALRDFDPVYVGLGSNMRKPRNEHMSAALPPIADIAQHDCDDREVPKGDICSAANCILFDHLIGDRQELIRHVQAERPGGFHINHKLEFSGSHHGQIARLLSLENPPGIDTGLSKGA